MLTVLTPDDTVRHLQAMTSGVPYESFSISLAPPGLPAREMRESLELFAAKVMPLFK
jgi:CubicO group peptidase (beta-lactamase class C family)